MRGRKAQQRRAHLLEQQSKLTADGDRTRCYCARLDLEYPHHLNEHTEEHDAERELRAARAGGTE